ncbi:MAG TPA: fluoride efflux transporter CrcB [Gemmatimonadaceae bacterium]|jgi:CrcB protein|nr:fluoride efflux transporter CrcB [Gemmatimonadaceae bacterium]
MIWSIAIGSAVGGVSRYLLGLFVQQATGIGFPLGTLIINISGSLLLGFLLRWGLITADATPELRAMLTTGFCGGYTTFSTFSYETATLLEDGWYGRAALYVSLSIILSLAGVFLGVHLARTLFAVRERLPL